LAGAFVEKLYQESGDKKLVAGFTSIVPKRQLKLSLDADAEYEPKGQSPPWKLRIFDGRVISHPFPQSNEAGPRRGPDGLK
jgi:hypothetical protein